MWEPITGDPLGLAALLAAIAVVVTLFDRGIE